MVLIKKGVVKMSGKYSDFERFGSGDLMRLATNEAQITSAKALADHNQQVQKIKASMQKQEEARNRVSQERIRLEKIRNDKLAQTAALRYKKASMQSWLAIGVAMASLLVAIIK